MKQDIKSSAYLQTLNIIYYAQLVSLIVFSMIVFFLLNLDDEQEVNKELAGTLQYPLSATFIAGLAASQLIPRLVLKKIDITLSLKEKLSRYVPSIIIRGTCIELPGLVACVVAFITAQIYYLMVIPLLVIMFLMYRPSRSSIANELNLSVTERELLNDPNAIVGERNQEEE